MIMNNKIVLMMILLILTAIGCSRLEPTTSNSQDGNQTIYCSSDGTLSTKQTIQSHRSYCIKSDSASKMYSTNTPTPYSFLIIDDQGNIVTTFERTHTELMHLIIVRTDLNYFQHVHPAFNPKTGTFTLNDLTFPADGRYRVFADFAVSDGQKDPHGIPFTITISEDVPIGPATYVPAPLGSEEKTKTFEGYEVTLSSATLFTAAEETKISFILKQQGKPLTDLEEYLGALGHSVILKEETLDFIHTHPITEVHTIQTGNVDFLITFPESGRYKIFTQFKKNGKVFTTDFIVTVQEHSNALPPTNEATHLVTPPMH